MRILHRPNHAPGRPARYHQPILERLEDRTLFSIDLNPNFWTSIGPAPVNDTFATAPLTTPAGRIAVAVEDPTDANIMYIGTDRGGVWKTLNWQSASPTWFPVMSNQSSLAVGSWLGFRTLILAPTNHNVLFVAVSGPGGGIFRSIDAGLTWFALSVHDFNGAEFGALAISPTDPSTLYASVWYGGPGGGGVYRSTDGGKDGTWVNTTSDFHHGQASDVVVDPANPSVVYAGLVLGGTTNGVYKSTLGGATGTWTRLENGILKGTDVGYAIRLAVAPSQDQTLYATVFDPALGLSTNGGGLPRRYTSANAGANWVGLQSIPGNAEDRRWHVVLAVDPTNAQLIYANNAYSLFGFLNGSSINWNQTSLDDDFVGTFFDATGALVVVGDRGIYRSADQGATWAARQGNLRITEFYDVTLDPNNPDRAFGVAQDQLDVLSYTGDPVWNYIGGGLNGDAEAGKVLIDPGNANRLYFYQPLSHDQAVLRSDTGGTNWVPKTNGLPMHAEQDYPFAYAVQRAFVIDQSNPDRLLLGTDQVFETTDGAESWHAISDTLSPGAFISALAVAPGAPGTVYAATTDGRLLATDTNGPASSWEVRDYGLETIDNNFVEDIDVDPHDAQRLVVVSNGVDLPRHVWMTNAGGQLHSGQPSWINITGDLPVNIAVHTVFIDWRYDVPVIYIGTDRGVYRSANGGAHWYSFGFLPNTWVTDLEFMPKFGILAAATFGRGVYEIPIAGPGATFSPGVTTTPTVTQNVAPNLFNCCPVEPTISVNPTDPGNVVYSSQGGLKVSTDGGATFSALVAFPLANDGGDTTTVFDSQGRLYWANINYGTSGLSIVQLDPATGRVRAGPFDVDIPPGVAPRFSDDKEVLAADNDGNLFIVWTSNVTGGSQVYLARSTDHGRTWPQVVTVSPDPSVDNSEGVVWPTDVTVDPEGNVLVSYHSQPGWSGGNSDGTSGQTFVASYSNDLGTLNYKTLVFGPGASDITANNQSNGVGVNASRTIPGAIFWTQGSWQPWVLADPARPGNVYVLAADDPNNGAGGDPSDIVFASSTSNGAPGTWNTFTLESGPSNTFRLFPTAAIDSSGTIVVAWYDNRRGLRNAAGHYLLDVYATFSNDGGQTWATAFQVNADNNPFDPDAGAVNLNHGPPPTTRVGEYFGITVDGGTAYLAWNGNTRDVSGNPTGQQVWIGSFSIAGSLTVTGDALGLNADDTITIRSLPNNPAFAEILVNDQRQYVGQWAGLTGGITIAPGRGLNTVNVEDLPANVPLTITCASADTINLGKAGSVQSIAGPVVIGGGPDLFDLNIDDSADRVGRFVAIRPTSVFGLAPAAITFAQIALGDLTIKGGSGGNTFNITNTFNDQQSASITTLDTGSGNDKVNVQRTSGWLFVNGDAGSDTVTVGSLAPTLGGTTAGIQGRLVVGNATGQTALTIDDEGDTAVRTVVITDHAASGLPGVPIEYTPLEVSVMVLGGHVPGGGRATPGATANTFNVVSTAAGSPVLLQLGNQGDTVVFSPSNHNLQDIAGSVTIRGAGSNAVTFNDQAYVGFGINSVTSSGFAASGSASVNYSGIGMVTFNLSNASGGVTLIDNIPAGMQVVINGGATAQAVSLSNNAGNLDNLKGSIAVYGGSGGLDLQLNDANDTSPSLWQLTNQTVTRLGSATVTYNHLRSLTLMGGKGGVTFTVQGTPAGVPVTVSAGAGQNNLAGPDTANTWHLRGSNTGDVNGQVQYQGMTSLTGGSANDTFVFANGATMTGVVDGKAGLNTLDYTAYQTATTVDLIAGTATGVAGGIRNIGAVRGATVVVTAHNPPPITPTAGVAVNNVTVATFADGLVGSQPTDYTATITWGDGTTSAGTVVVAPGGGFAVQGSHTYTDEGIYSVSVAIQALGRTHVTPTAAVHVARVGPPPDCLGEVAVAFTRSAEAYGNFVRAAYATYLGRPNPAPAEVAAWVSLMQAGLTDEQLEASFIGSPEYISNHGGQGAGWVRGMYHDLLHRDASDAEVNAWVSLLNSGTQPYAIALGFAASPEREGIRVAQDYADYLGRGASQSEIAAWVDLFIHHGAGNEDVVAGFVGSSEYFQSHYDNIADWLTDAYRAVLHRLPDEASYRAGIEFLMNC
jgi:hypothetical protein